MTDQALLTDYLRGRHGAFRELLERHVGLVHGVAWRVTRDGSLAEEAVQDVFCLLAKKSATLVSHPSVAGWLHRTAVNVSRDLARRRTAHERKLARYAQESAVAVPDQPRPVAWDEIDALIDRLPADERAVIVLRFFEELEHGQIAERLRISAPAARKRLSRGLARLQQRLALQAGSLAIAAPAPLLASVMAQVPAVAPAAGFSTLIALMTQKQFITAVAAVLALGGTSWFAIVQQRENERLAAHVAALQQQLTAKSAAPPSPTTASPDSPAAGAADATSPDALRAELAAETAKRTAAEKALAELRAQTDSLRDQVVVAYGKVGDIGNNLGSLFNEARALIELEKAGKLKGPEVEARLEKFMKQAASMTGLSQEIVQFESKPEEGSRFAAAAYGSVFGLDEAGQNRVADVMEKTLVQASEQKLTLGSLPERTSPDFMPWLEKRWAFFNQSRDSLRTALPEEKRADFDQLVEKGGYGFKNLTFKGSPLMFSLGGDPR